MTQNLEDTAVHAIAWVATEYHYLEALQEELQSIEKETDLDQEIKHVKKALRVLRFIGNAERRANRYEERLEKLFGEVYNNNKGFFYRLSHKQEAFVDEQKQIADHHIKDTGGEKAITHADVKKLCQELEVERRRLIQLVSRYSGELTEDIKETEGLLYLEKKYTGDQKNEFDKKLKVRIEAIDEKITLVMQWVAGTEATLEKIKKVSESKEFVGHSTLKSEGITILKEAGFPVKENQKFTDFLASQPAFLHSLETEAIKGLINLHKLHYRKNWGYIKQGLTELNRRGLSLFLNKLLPNIGFAVSREYLGWETIAKSFKEFDEVKIAVLAKFFTTFDFHYANTKGMYYLSNETWTIYIHNVNLLPILRTLLLNFKEKKNLFFFCLNADHLEGIFQLLQTKHGKDSLPLLARIYESVENAEIRKETEKYSYATSFAEKVKRVA